MTEAKPHATFAKLKDGTWGIRVAGNVEPGAKIQVTRRDGSISEAEVVRVVWSGDDVSLCEIKRNEPKANPAKDTKKAPF